MLDADVVVGALGKYLVLDLNADETRGLGNVNRSVLMHGIAPAACPVENEGAITYTDDLETRLRHLRERNVRFKNGLSIAHRPTTEMERFKTRLRCKLAHQGG
jgi:hypothetical protein